ncbi:MAG: methyltransferase domain-containing protein [bacterium]
MEKSVYDRIGKNYTRHRRADIRIVERIISILDLTQGSVIADIGAGTGNYAAALAGKGYAVKAVEPSPVMMEQALPAANVEWLNGAAEDIPLHDKSVDGVICVFAFHHFKSPEKAVLEMDRVCQAGPIVLFTFDPWQIPRPWIGDYFPDIWESALKIFPPLTEVETLFADVAGRKVSTSAFELPHDLRDNFLAAGWRRPEIYLDPEIRACMSGFALADQNEVEKGTLRLQRDLETGDWEKKYGRLRSAGAFDAGYRFLCAGKR